MIEPLEKGGRDRTATGLRMGNGAEFTEFAEDMHSADSAIIPGVALPLMIPRGTMVLSATRGRDLLAIFTEYIYVHWRVPFTDLTIWEGMLLAEQIAILKALAVVLTLLGLAIVEKRRENLKNDPHRK